MRLGGEPRKTAWESGRWTISLSFYPDRTEQLQEQLWEISVGAVGEYLSPEVRERFISRTTEQSGAVSTAEQQPTDGKLEESDGKLDGKVEQDDGKVEEDDDRIQERKENGADHEAHIPESKRQ